MKVLFYILSFIAAAPIGLYANLKYPFKYKILNTIIKILFGIKLLFEILVLGAFIFEGNNFILPIIFYLILLLLNYANYKYSIVLNFNFSDSFNMQNGIPLNKEYTELQGEILEFEYRKKYSLTYEHKRVLVDKVTLKNNYIYINGTDLDKNVYRTYRLDRAILND